MSLSYCIKAYARFFKWKHNLTNIDIKLIDHAFFTEVEFYLRSKRKCNNNSAVNIPQILERSSVYALLTGG